MVFFGTAIGIWKLSEGVPLWEIKVDNGDAFDFDEEEIIEARDIYQDYKDINADDDNDKPPPKNPKFTEKPKAQAQDKDKQEDQEES